MNEANYVSSSANTYEEFERARKEKSNNAILEIGGVSASMAGAAYLLNTDIGQSAASRLFKLNILNDYIRYNDTAWSDLAIKRKVTLGDLSLAFAKGAEELSPFKILRTFHTSSLLSVTNLPKDTVPINITATQLFLDEEYFRKLFAEKGNNLHPQVIDEVFRSGAVYQSGKLYSADMSSTLLEHARIVSLSPDVDKGLGEKSSPFLNRVYEKFRNVMGVEDASRFYNAALSENGKLGVIAGKSQSDMMLGWSRAFGRLSIEPGFKIFDKPLDFFAELIDKTGLPQKYNFLHGVRDSLSLGLGTKGDYTKSVPRSFAMSAGNIAKASLMAGAGLSILNEVVKSVADQSSPFDKGILPGLATGYTTARVGVASAWSDNFQGYKERQEYYAPGSTSVIALAGFPLAGAMFGGTVGYSTRLASTAIRGFAETEKIFARETESSLVNKVLLRDPADGVKLTKVKKLAALGAIVGAIPALPFLPGALVGESSEQLRKEYSGEEDVAIRSTRFWTSGGTEYEGGKIKYFTKSWYSQLMNDAETVGKYGDQETKSDLNPFLHPFDYLRNPYRYEELNQERSPYPVWGMSVSHAGVFGKIFEGTIGRVIKPDLVNERLSEYVDGGSLDSEQGVSLKQKVTDEEASLVQEGKMLAPENAKMNLNRELADGSYNALTDFAGLKGWAVSLMNDYTHTGVGDSGLQLARSGESNNIARDLLERNLGGMGPIGESLRRFIPTNSGSIVDSANPLRNLMPEWLPHDPNNYWQDFSIGDPYSKVDRGYYRLPGEGYSELFPELKGIDPKDYPDIFKYKILSDVALGSDEYYQYKDIMEARSVQGQLTDYEQGMYSTIKDQESQRSIQKRFATPLTKEDMQDAGFVDTALSSLWSVSSRLAEAPTETLTFFRPAAKFIHQRTATEDYIATQIEGSDVGMWTKPYDHFLKPFANKLDPSNDMPEEAQERNAIDTYFDRLEYMKYRNLYKESVASGDGNAHEYKKKYQATVTGALTTGLDENMEVTRAYIALPDRQKAYFAAFSGATSSEERSQIVDMVPTDIANLYSKLWKRRDAIAGASSPEAQTAAVMNIVSNEESDLISDNRGLYEQYKRSNEKESSSFSEFVQDKEVESYVKRTTGVPDRNFAGWDPRIDMKDIKLQTLSIGKEDVREYGFWDSDENRLRRLSIVQQEKQVTGQIEQIKNSIKEEKRSSASIKSELYKRGVDVDSVQFHISKTDNLNFNIGA